MIILSLVVGALVCAVVWLFIDAREHERRMEEIEEREREAAKAAIAPKRGRR